MAGDEIGERRAELRILNDRAYKFAETLSRYGLIPATFTFFLLFDLVATIFDPTESTQTIPFLFQFFAAVPFAHAITLIVFVVVLLHTLTVLSAIRYLLIRMNGFIVEDDITMIGLRNFLREMSLAPGILNPFFMLHGTLLSRARREGERQYLAVKEGYYDEKENTFARWRAVVPTGIFSISIGLVVGYLVAVIFASSSAQTLTGFFMLNSALSGIALVLTFLSAYSTGGVLTRVLRLEKLCFQYRAPAPNAFHSEAEYDRRLSKWITDTLNGDGAIKYWFVCFSVLSACLGGMLSWAFADVSSYDTIIAIWQNTVDSVTNAVRTGFDAFRNLY